MPSWCVCVYARAVERVYNDLDLCDTSLNSVIHSTVPTESPQGMCFSALLSTTYIRASTSDTTTLPVIGSNNIFQEVGYSEKSTVFSSLKGQALYAVRQLHKFPGLEKDNSSGNSLCAWIYPLRFCSCIKEAGNTITWLHSRIKGRFWAGGEW